MGFRQQKEKQRYEVPACQSQTGQKHEQAKGDRNNPQKKSYPANQMNEAKMNDVGISKARNERR